MYELFPLGNLCAMLYRNLAFVLLRVEGPDAKKTACYDIDVEIVSAV